MDLLTYFPVPIEFSCGKPSETLQESLSAERRQEHPRRALRLRLRKGGLLLPPRWRVGPASRGIDPVDSRGPSHPLCMCMCMCASARTLRIRRMSFQTLYCVGAMWEGKATPTFRPIRLDRVESVGGDGAQGELTRPASPAGLNAFALSKTSLR